MQLRPLGRIATTLFLILLLFSYPPAADAYGVLSHEELIDITWDSDIKPALLHRFPTLSETDLQQAHSYAYGGSMIQDIGYYPFGSHEFTNYLHYVRTGDFVAGMLRDARDPNEFAFALGALSHYAADCWGHAAVNAGVAVEYPELRARYGPQVTYEEDPAAHLKTEFSFDVLQVAKRRYLSKQYHDFVGFQISRPLLDRAFLDTYGIETREFLKSGDLAVGTFRFAISHAIPEMTQVAVASRKDTVQEEKDDRARSLFLYHLSRADYEKDFGASYHRPGVFAKILAFLLKLIPKFGPFKALAYKDPTPQTEDLYFKSMDNVVSQYHRLLQQVEHGDYNIPNRNLDVGDLTVAGHYRMADDSYDELVRRLAKEKFAHLTPALKANILGYFASGSPRDSLHRLKWHETRSAFTKLKAYPVSAVVPAS